MTHQEFIELFNHHARTMDNADVEFTGEPEIESFHYRHGCIEDTEFSSFDMDIGTIDGDKPADVHYIDEFSLNRLSDEVISQLSRQVDTHAISNAVSKALTGSLVLSISDGKLVVIKAKSLAQAVIQTLQGEE